MLNDLPDFDDSDIVETVPVQDTDAEASVVYGDTSPAEAPNTGGPPASFSSSEADRREVDDILIVDAEEPELREPELEPELPKPELPEPEIILISSDDDDLYADVSRFLSKISPASSGTHIEILTVFLSAAKARAWAQQHHAR